MVASPSSGIYVHHTACMEMREERGGGYLTDDEACEATGWVIRTLLLPLLEAGWQGEGLGILGE